jgi:hypothetical protein
LAGCCECGDEPSGSGATELVILVTLVERAKKLTLKREVCCQHEDVTHQVAKCECEIQPVVYSGCRITAMFCYVAVRRKGRSKGQGVGRWQRACLSMRTVTENVFAFLIWTQSDSF